MASPRWRKNIERRHLVFGEWFQCRVVQDHEVQEGNAIMGQSGNNFSIRNNWVIDTGLYGIFPNSVTTGSSKTIF